MPRALKQTIKSLTGRRACAFFLLLICAVFNAAGANAATGDVSSFAGMGRNYGDGGPALTAALNHPFGLALSPDGTVFIADTYNMNIRKVDISGNIQTIASGFFAYTLAYAGDYVYLDGGRVPSGGGGLQSTSISLSLIASDGASLYQIRGNDLVKILDGISGSGTSLASIGPDTWRHLDHYDGKLYAFGESMTACYDIAAESLTSLPAIPFGQLSNIRDMAFDGTYLYVSESFPYPYAPADPADNVHRIRRVRLETGLVEDFLGGRQGDIDGVGVQAAFSFPQELVLGPGGKLYIADLFNHKIKRADTQTAGVVTIVGAGHGSAGLDRLSATLKSPLNLDGDKAGNIYIAELGGQRILKIDKQGVVSVLAGSGIAGDVDGIGVQAQFRYPCHVTVQGDFLYVADFGTHKIRRVHIASGEVTTLAGKGKAGFADGTLAEAEFAFPWGIFSRDGRIYVADTGNHVIREIDLALNRVRTLAGMPGVAGYADGMALEARFNAPRGLSVDDKNIYIADSENHLVRRLDLETLEVTTIAGSIPQSGYVDNSDPTMVRFTQPWGISWGDTKVYVADTGNNRLRQIEKETGQTTTLAGSGLWGDVDGSGSGAQFKYPHGLYCKPEAGILFVADTHNHKIRAVEIPRSSSPNPPEPLSDLEAQAFEGLKIELTWALSSSGDVIRQNVYMAESGKAFNFFLPVAVLEPNVASWIATEDLEDGITYRFIVRAENEFLEEKNTNEVSATAFNIKACPVARIKVPKGGKKVSGNRLTVIAQMGGGDSGYDTVQKVLFQYRPILQPDFENILAANPNHPNPDSSLPYFVHWDVSQFANGEYFVRAQSYCAGLPSNGAPHIIIYVEHANPDVIENQDGDKQHKQAKVAKHKVNEVTISHHTSEYTATVFIPAGAIDNDEDDLSLELGDQSGGEVFPQSVDQVIILTELDVSLLSGQSQLQSPANIIISYDNDEVQGSGLSLQSLSLAYFVPERNIWEPIPSQVNTAERTVIGITSHFSRFGLGYFIKSTSVFEFKEVYAYPNPARGGQKPRIHVEAGSADIIKIRIYDVAGNLVHKAQMPGPDVDYVWEGYIPSGVYIYVVEARKQGFGTLKKVSKLAVIR